MTGHNQKHKHISPIKELAKLHWFSERLLREVLNEFYTSYYDTGGSRIEVQIERYLDDVFDRKTEVKQGGKNAGKMD